MRYIFITILSVVLLISCGKKNYQKEFPLPPNTHAPVIINGEAKGFNHVSGGTMHDSFFTVNLALTDGNYAKYSLLIGLAKKH